MSENTDIKYGLHKDQGLFLDLTEIKKYACERSLL